MAKEEASIKDGLIGCGVLIVLVLGVAVGCGAFGSGSRAPAVPTSRPKVVRPQDRQIASWAHALATKDGATGEAKYQKMLIALRDHCKETPPTLAKNATRAIAKLEKTGDYETYLSVLKSVADLAAADHKNGFGRTRCLSLMNSLVGSVAIENGGKA